MSPGTLPWVLLSLQRLRPGGFRLRERLRAALEAEDGGTGPGRPVPDPWDLLGGQEVARPWASEARRVLAACQQRGVRLVTPGDTSYPVALLHSGDPPPVLYVRGDPAALVRARLGVVGSRRVTSGALGWARSLGQLAVGGGLGLVAGFTSSIERAAVRGAVVASGGAPVVCVLPYGPWEGLSRVRAGELEAVLAGGGALVTRVPPDHGAFPGAHQARNHLLAHLVEELILVQAGLPSGALDVARRALEAGRRVRVAAVDRGGEGGRRLLEEGAEELAHPCDLLDLEGRLGRALPRAVRLLEDGGPMAPDHLLGRLGATDRRGPLRLERLVRLGWVTWTGDGRLAAGYRPLLEGLERLSGGAAAAPADRAPASGMPASW